MDELSGHENANEISETVRRALKIAFRIDAKPPSVFSLDDITPSSAKELLASHRSIILTVVSFMGEDGVAVPAGTVVGLCSHGIRLTLPTAWLEARAAEGEANAI